MTVPFGRGGLIDDATELAARFPLPPALARSDTLAGRQAFADAFIAARDKVEADYYAVADQRSSPGARSRRFLASTLKPVIGRPIGDVEQFYQTYGRLVRWAWLSISIGVYDAEIHAVPDTARRLILAQVNTVDTTWRPAVSRLADLGGKGLIVEVGTGRGNSVARLATLLPEARIVSITISPEQHEIVRELVRELGLTNVEVRRGDIFDPSVTADLVGQADAVGAIEVILHFRPPGKVVGMRTMAGLLRPGGVLCVMDSAVAKPLGAFAERFYANQSIYFGRRDEYFRLFDQARLLPVGYVDHSPNMAQTFKDTTRVLRTYRPQLKQEFGWIMSRLWPEVPGGLYVPTLRNLRYVHVVGARRHGG
jgi:cyclopropane fatty-acyl-phospholipid synthase-like methyltransferase